MGSRRRLTVCCAAVAVALLGACGDRAAPAATALPPASATDYVIGPGDTLSVFVFRAPELSADLPVRPDGRLSLPLIPDIEAAGRTPTELGKEIETRLKEYVREPNVTVMVRSFIGPTSRQIRVIGEAAQPKAIPFREGLSVLDVMIEVGGLTRYASGNRAEIVRRGAEGEPASIVRVRLADLLRNGDIRQDVRMQPGDTLIIPQSWF